MNYRDANLDISRAIHINPRFVQAYIARGNMYMKLKHYSKAAEDYTLAIEINPSHLRAYLNRAIAFRRDGKYAAAIRDLNQFLGFYKNDYV